MSASPIARQACTSHAQAIPSKKVLVTDASQLPDVYSSTPGGTLYSTTPGGKYKLIKDSSCLNVVKSEPAIVQGIPRISIHSIQSNDS